MTGCLTPSSVSELASALSRCTGNSRILAGGTDYVIRSRRTVREPDYLLYLGGVPELRTIAPEGDYLRIGSMVTMGEASSRLSGHAALCALADAAGDVGSPQIRAKATLAGNLCNASPAGDMLPVSLLFGTLVEILSADGSVARVPVEEFILGPGKTVLTPGRAVTALLVPETPFLGWVSAFRKIGSRERVSIARESLAIAVLPAGDGTFAAARVTLGAVANTPIRVPEAERLLIGRPADDALLSALTDIISRTVHENCRPANRLYKTEAARGLTADVLELLLRRAAAVSKP